MRAHLDEAKLQRLLHGQAKPAELAQIRGHLVVCARCTQRVREWTPLFPEAADVLPPGQRLPPPLPGTASRVVVPSREAYADGQHRSRLKRVAGAGLLVGLAVAAFLLRDRIPLPEHQRVSELPETLAPPPAEPGVSAPDTAEFPSVADTAVPPDTAIAAGGRPSQPTPPPSRPTVAPIERPTPRPEQPTPQPSPAEPAAAESDTAQAVTVADPDNIRRVTLGDALQALGGEVRLLQGITPTRVELVPSREVPGATAGVPVVRISYSEPAGGTMVLEEQRLPSREGPAEPQVSIDSIPGGNAATWVDRAGFRLRITVPGDQSMVLRMVNRVQ